MDFSMSYFIVFLFPKTHDFKQLEDVWVRRAYPCWSRVVYYTKGSKTEMQTEPQHWSLWVLNHIHLRFWGYRLEQFWCTVVAIYYSFFSPPDTLSEMYFYVQKVGAGWLQYVLLETAKEGTCCCFWLVLGTLNQSHFPGLHILFARSSTSLEQLSGWYLPNML